MAYAEHTQAVIDIAANVTEALSAFYVPVVDGVKEINDEAVTITLQERWEELEQDVEALIEETETAWASIPNTDDEDVDFSE